jgi:hypothetical protein
MLGTVKSCVPELVLVEELVARGELFGLAEAVAVTEGLAAAECRCVGEADGVGDAVGVSVTADVGEPPDGPAKAADDPLAAAADGMVEGFDPLAPHALRPAPQMTAATITAGTRHILMLLPSDK